jgi:hypothetical protein
VSRFLLFVKLLLLVVEAVKKGKGELARQRLIEELRERDDEKTTSELRRILDD